MILALDTAGPYPAVAAVTTEGKILFSSSGQRTRAHAEDLTPLLRQALRNGEPTFVAVGRGPGAFTGLRVGLVAAKAIGWARDIPVVGICSLDIVAQQFDLAEGCAILDARRGEVYLAKYRQGRRIEGPTVLAKELAKEKIADQISVGDAELLEQPDRRARGTTNIDPQALAVVAFDAYQSGSTEAPEPDYLRAPDVTLSKPSLEQPS